MDKSYFYGNRFGQGLLLARRLVEAGARFIQVEYQYGPFKGFDMHESGQSRMVEMKKQIDRPIAQLIRELDERGLLDRTLVMISTEFGRTIASAPAAGQEPDGFAERNTGKNLVIENEKMYGFHGHFSTCNTMLFFGGGFKKGFAYGKTADEHPMLAVENPVQHIDALATMYKALGIPADANYVTEGRPFYVTNNGKGQAVDAMLA
jgi:arylsulfatase A-like enzyme